MITFHPPASGLRNLHPLTKLAMTGSLAAIGLALPGTWLSYVLFTFVLVPIAAWGRFLVRFLTTALVLVIPFAISLVLIQGLFWQDGTPLISLGPVSLKREGIEFAIAGVGRIAIFMGTFMLLLFSTPPEELTLALTERGMPGSLAYIILTTIQIVPRFQARAEQIINAQHARGLETEGSLSRRARALVPLVVPLVLGSIVDVEERAIALEARAFSRQGPKTSLLVLQDTRTQLVARWLMVIAALAFVILRFIPGVFP